MKTVVVKLSRINPSKKEADTHLSSNQATDNTISYFSAFKQRCYESNCAWYLGSEKKTRSVHQPATLSSTQYKTVDDNIFSRLRSECGKKMFIHLQARLITKLLFPLHCFFSVTVSHCIRTIRLFHFVCSIWYTLSNVYILPGLLLLFFRVEFPLILSLFILY